MLKRLVPRRITASGVISVVALVLATTGGAYAASRVIIKSTNQISPKVLKQLRGAKGAQGTPGTPGTPGTAGTPGAKGDPGAPGANGANGTSVTSSEFTGVKSKCKEGGAEVTSASGTTLICNGEPGIKGKEGKEGSPWTAGGTLPSEKTETGTWAFGQIQGTFSTIRVALSFPIPLAEPESIVGHVINHAGKEVIENVQEEKFEEVAPTGCSGTTDKPTAEPGNLCMYTEELADSIIVSGEPMHIKASGALPDVFNDELGPNAQGSGTFAVTAK
jgi:hypothetical protein